jgi:hypothetical protein
MKLIENTLENPRNPHGTASAIIARGWPMNEAHARRISSSSTMLVFNNNKVKPEQVAVLEEFQRVRGKIEEVSEWLRGWDGYNASPVSAASRAQALEFLALFGHRLSVDRGQPNVGTDGRGFVTLEWSRGERSLVVYFRETDIVFVRSWGSDFHDDMAHGFITKPYDLTEQIEWVQR